MQSSRSSRSHKSISASGLEMLPQRVSRAPMNVIPKAWMHKETRDIYMYIYLYNYYRAREPHILFSLYTAHTENSFRRHISNLMFRPVMSKSGALQRHRMARVWPICKRYTHTNFFFSIDRYWVR